MNQNQSQTNDIDHILRLWAQAYLPQEKITIHEGCQHEPKFYLGFREEYEFCLKCDAKKLNGVWVEANPKID